MNSTKFSKVVAGLLLHPAIISFWSQLLNAVRTFFQKLSMSNLVGLLGIEPSLHPPEGRVLPVYDSPILSMCATDVGAVRFELTTPWSQTRCPSHWATPRNCAGLSYRFCMRASTVYKQKTSDERWLLVFVPRARIELATQGFSFSVDLCCQRDRTISSPCTQGLGACTGVLLGLTR